MNRSILYIQLYQKCAELIPQYGIVIKFLSRIFTSSYSEGFEFPPIYCFWKFTVIRILDSAAIKA